MKIVFITNVCAHYVVGLFECLAKRYDIEFYFTGGHESYWRKANEFKYEKFKGQTLKGWMLGSKIRLTPGLIGVLFKPYDVMIKTLDDRLALLMLFLFSRMMHRPFILWTGVWAHPQTWFHRLTFQGTRLIYQHSDAIVVYGEHVRRYLIELGIEPQKIFCAPHATDNNNYNQEATAVDKAKLKKKLGLAEGQSVVLFVGRFEPGKGLEHLIRAVHDLQAIKPVLLMVGDGSYEHEIRRQCEARQMPYRLAGHVPNKELYQYYALADVFVLPSVTTSDFKEPWGFVINEAMNQGCPVVATDAVGAASGGLVQEGQTGFIVPEADSTALSIALKKILTDEDLKAAMGRQARTRIAAWGHPQMADGFTEAIAYVSRKRA